MLSVKILLAVSGSMSGSSVTSQKMTERDIHVFSSKPSRYLTQEYSSPHTQQWITAWLDIFHDVSLQEYSLEHYGKCMITVYMYITDKRLGDRLLAQLLVFPSTLYSPIILQRSFLTLANHFRHASLSDGKAGFSAKLSQTWGNNV